MPYHVDESPPDDRPLNDLRLLPAEETVEDGWLILGREPLQLLVAGRRQLLRVVYRRGADAPLTGISLFSRKSKPDRKAWSRAYPLDFRAAYKDSPPEANSLWIRRGDIHPPLRRLALISGQWADSVPGDTPEIRSQWKLVQLNFSDTLADFVYLAFSARTLFTGTQPPS